MMILTNDAVKVSKIKNDFIKIYDYAILKIYNYKSIQIIFKVLIFMYLFINTFSFFLGKNDTYQFLQLTHIYMHIKNMHMAKTVYYIQHVHKT